MMMITVQCIHLGISGIFREHLNEFSEEESSMYLYDCTGDLHYCTLLKLLFVFLSGGFLHITVIRINTEQSRSKMAAK